MPFYMLQVAYTPEVLQGDDRQPVRPQGSRRARWRGRRRQGASICYFAFGKYDVVVIIEAPDDVARPARRWRSPPADGFVRRRDHQAPDQRGGDGGDDRRAPRSRPPASAGGRRRRGRIRRPGRTPPARRLEARGRGGDRRVAGLGAEAELLGADEGHVGQAHEAEEVPEVGLLEVEGRRRALAVEAAAALDDDDPLAGRAGPAGPSRCSGRSRRRGGRGRTRRAASSATLKLYIGAPMTMVSAARSSAISASERARAACSRSAAGTPRMPATSTG